MIRDTFWDVTKTSTYRIAPLQPDRGAQGEVRVPHPAHDAGAEEGRGERKELLLRLTGGR